MSSGAPGFTEWLLFHLWKPNPKTNRCCPLVNVPDTIFYQWAKPTVWYRTVQQGELVRQPKKLITHQYISEDFLGKELEIVARFIIFKDFDLIKHNTATVEFLPRAGFLEFISNRNKPLSGLLQKWVPPENAHNSEVKVTWSSHFYSVEKRTSLRALGDSTAEWVARLATFEGQEHWSKLEPLKNATLLQHIHQTCMSVIDHVFNVSGGNVKISSLILYFKVGPRNHL